MPNNYYSLIKESFNGSKKHQELVASFEGWKIYLVDGTWVRDNKETAFIGGDNPAADRIKLPGKTIWIEKLFNREDQLAFLVHELVEYFQITHNKKDYDDAHNDANIWEKKYRDGLDAISVFNKVMENHQFVKTAIGLWEAFSKKKINESDSLDFGEVPSDVDYTSSAPVATIDKSPNDKRKELLWKIKTGEVSMDNFPSIFKDLSTFIKQDGDRYILSNTNAPNTKLGRLYPKLYRWVTTGVLGDLIDAPNSPFVRRVVRLAANEVERHLHSDHPSRQFAALDKRGALDDIINNYMALNYFDMFVIPNIKEMIKNEVMERRKRKDLDEQNSLFREKIKSLLY